MRHTARHRPTAPIFWDCRNACSASSGAQLLHKSYAFAHIVKQNKHEEKERRRNSKDQMARHKAQPAEEPVISLRPSETYKFASAELAIRDAPLNTVKGGLVVTIPPSG